jgi:hypothetical protein
MSGSPRRMQRSKLAAWRVPPNPFIVVDSLRSQTRPSHLLVMRSAIVDSPNIRRPPACDNKTVRQLRPTTLLGDLAFPEIMEGRAMSRTRISLNAHQMIAIMITMQLKKPAAKAEAATSNKVICLSLPPIVGLALRAPKNSNMKHN